MRLKVGTYNICHGEGIDKRVNLSRQGSFLKSNDLDIIFLQEIDIFTTRSNYNGIEELAKGVGFNNYYFGKTSDVFNGEYGNGILSKYNIIESNNYLIEVDKTHETRGICHCKIEVDDKKINLFSVHLPVYYDERIIYINKLIEIINNIKDEAIIVGGDFNVGYKKMGDHKYICEKKEEYLEYELLKKYLKKVNNEEITWISAIDDGCIDTIFYSNNIKLIKYENVNNSCSDHSLVEVLLDI